MSKNKGQPSQPKESEESTKDSDASKCDSLQLNKTPPAPPQETTPANFTESHKEITVFVQTESEGDES